MIRGPNGEVQRESFSRYFLRLTNTNPMSEYISDDKHVRRDRKVFNKQNLRAFLKHTLFREPWIGAPWLVREHFAIKYRLPMDIPVHLLQESRLLVNKVSTHSSFVSYLQQQFPGAADAFIQQHLLQTKPPRKRAKNFSQDEYNRIQHEEMQLRQMQQVSGLIRS